MGDRYTLFLNCAWCNHKQEVWYAESCDCTDFECEECGGLNDIEMDFKAVKSKKRENVNFFP